MTNQVIPEAAVPMIARNAAFLVLASKYPNSDLVYSVEFGQALKAALEAAAPHMLAALRPYTIEDQRKHGETW